MKKQTYKLLVQALQLLAVIFAVLLITALFSLISRICDPAPQEALKDEMQINEMQNYQSSEGRTDIIFF